MAAVEFSRGENGFRVLNRELELPAQPVSPRSFVPRLASELSVPELVRHRALELAERGERDGIAIGVQPSGFAAACLYLAGQELGYSVTQTRLADVAVTSTNGGRYRMLNP